jgi:hypothetical protein
MAIVVGPISVISGAVLSEIFLVTTFVTSIVLMAPQLPSGRRLL